MANTAPARVTKNIFPKFWPITKARPRSRTYLARRPETVVALAYFDFDIHAPTRAALGAIAPHLTKGSVLVFDQLNCPEYPGETLALAETFGLNRCRIRRSPLTPWMSFVLGEDLF